MSRVLLILTLICSAGLARAETITLRSGDHADFARLVAFLPVKPKWTVEQKGRRVEVEIIGRKSHEFDTSSVFDRIPRTRIAAVSQAGANRLTIDLACDCTVSSFFQAPRMLVIDVTDAEPAETVMTEAPPEMREAFRDQLIKRQSYSTSSLSQFAEALAQQTTREVLEIGTGDGAGRPKDSRTAGLRNLDLPNIALPGGAGARSGASSARDTNCDMLAKDPLGRFSEPGDFAAQKAGITAKLYTEGLDLDAGAAIDLAQLYLSRGLGAEARQILDMTGRDAGGAAFLADIAAVIEEREDVPRDRLEAFAHCAPGNALWPVLAGAQARMADETGWQVARAAEALPRDLLRIIAPRLIANLVASGQPDPASLVDKILDRSGGTAGKSMADVLLATDESEQEVILDEISQSNTAEAATASAMLVDRHVQAGKTVPEPLSDLVASQAEEQRHGDPSGMLRKAEAFSLISRGEFETALGILKSGALGTSEQQATIAQFFAELSRKGDTVTFLKIALSETGLALTAPPEVRQAVAARLYENNFLAAASALLDIGEPLDPALLTQALVARLFGEVGIPDDMLFADADVGPEADEARYHALLSAGRLVEARQVGLGLGMADPVAPLLAPESGTPSEGDADPDPDRLTLAGANALTESTSDLAQAVAEMLGDPALRLDP
ncbi:MAG: hypothetical protein EP318_12400 [Rhodobacteraceae bacterium]|nr:MAG: hypothetical protein EP318_12400 [Paracoccaceae bacterium]